MGEGGVADAAGEGGLEGVGEHVTPEAGGVPEGAGTARARVGLLAAVPPLVRPAGGDGEGRGVVWVIRVDACEC